MRPALCLAAMSCLTLPALAEPVTMSDAKQALADSGAEAMQLAYNEGNPAISGEIDERAFEAQLSGCTGDTLSCVRISLSACLPLPGESRIEALEFVNDWNSGAKLTVATAREDWLGPSACLRYSANLEGTARFGPDDVILWRIDLEDFGQLIADGGTGAAMADLLDNGAP
ncbi:MAG: hypothetical protein R3C13_05530 [Hyphomonas sp.]|uniref:hypothetical protein n=1 Tax=Hyphomonas sp. TaxID=87 RepID=UPI00352940AC